MQQFKVQNIWKQFETMDSLQQASCQTVWMLLFPEFQPPGETLEEL